MQGAFAIAISLCIGQINTTNEGVKEGLTREGSNACWEQRLKRKEEVHGSDRNKVKGYVKALTK